VDQRPALDGTPIAGLPIGEFGLHDEAGIDEEVQRGLVLKADRNRMGLAGGEDLDKIDSLALDLFKAVDRASTVAADRGPAAFGLGEAQGGRKLLSLRFFGIGMFAG